MTNPWKVLSDKDGDHRIRASFPSWLSYVEWVAKAEPHKCIDPKFMDPPPPPPIPKDGPAPPIKPWVPPVLASHKSKSNYDNWYGGVNWEDAVKMAYQGWPAIGERISKFTYAMSSKVGSKILRPVYSYAEEGDAFDVGRVCEGEPEAFISAYNVVTDGPSNQLVSIVYNGSASCSVSSEVIESRGACAVALAALLEQAGSAVQIVVAWSIYGGHGFEWRSDLDVVVKDYGDPLMVDSIGYALAHPTALRRLGFAALDAMPEEQWHTKMGTGINGSYGHPCNFEIGSDDDYEKHIVFDHGSWSGQWSDPKYAEKWIINALKKQGVHLDEGEQP